MACLSYSSCADGQACIDGTCVACPADSFNTCKCGISRHCSSCSADNQACQSCIQGYSGADCRTPICVSGCNMRQFCSAPGVCSYCGYLTPGSVCTCSAANCADCLPGKSTDGCSKCIPGYYLEETSCLPCSVQNCANCTAKYCKECQDGYHLQGAACVQCPASLTNCGLCSQDGKECLRCRRGYTGDGCSQCAKGFQNIALPGTPVQCESCPLNCASCGPDADSCLKCSKGFSMQNGTCQSSQVTAFGVYWILFCLLIAVFVSIVIFYVVKLGQKARSATLPEVQPDDLVIATQQ